MTILIGLTGSIGMGKSSTARLFEEEGCAVWDADAAVHRLYSAGGLATGPVSEAFPEAMEEGAVSRKKLKSILQERPDVLKEIERIVHPLVSQDRAQFLAESKSKFIVLDIPLLFETGADKGMDVTICVSVDEVTQRQRVLERGQMTEDDLRVILAKQMPDAEKRNRADYVVITDTPEHAKSQVKAILREIAGDDHA